MAVQYIGDNPLNGGISLGQAATSLVSLYGATPVAQRSSTVLATSTISASSYVTVGSNLTAIILELVNGQIALGTLRTTS